MSAAQPAVQATHPEYKWNAEEAEEIRFSLVRQILTFPQPYLHIAQAAFNAIENGAASFGEAEDDHRLRYAWRVINDYALGRLSPDRAKADAAEFAADFGNATESSPDVDSDDPKALGEKIRADLQRSLMLRARDEFRSWATGACERDLLIACEALSIAMGVQNGGEFNASFLCGMAAMFDREDIVFCPQEYVSAVQTYVGELTGRKVA